MYRPKSPMAGTKAMNFSPSPQSRRKIINTKTHAQEQVVYSKQRPSIGPHLEQKNQRKSILQKKTNLRNIQVDAQQLIDSFKVKQITNVNQTPKFCVRSDNVTGFSHNPHNNNIPYNFFSFGQKQTQKLKTQRKAKQKQQSHKQYSKSPKQGKKKPQGSIPVSGGLAHRNKIEIGVFDTTSRHRKTNQSYIR